MNDEARLQALNMPTVPPSQPRPDSSEVTPDIAKTQGWSSASPEHQRRENSALLPAVPGYEVLAELGRGGMGVVYKARQVKLNRLVALKMILAGGHAGPDQLARFRTEAEAVARLQHPSIVQIFEVGEHEGLPYFSLEFCAGGSLAAKLNGTPLPEKEAAQIVESLARAMHTAHQQHIIHRDLKPANVLLAVVSKDQSTSLTTDNWQQTTTPKITDFGLAKRLDTQGQTESGVVMGTPSYMAPEQAGGQTKLIGRGTDIYALGAILYELLTGRPPFKGPTSVDTILQVLHGEPAPLRLLNPKVERDLETICLKALEKLPQHRYASAADLADDLHCFLNGEAITVRSLNVLDRLTRTLQRNYLDVEFHAWGSLLWLWAGIVLLIHTVSFAVIQVRSSRELNWFLYILQFVLMGLAYLCYRPKQRRPASAAEQRLWVLWLAYLLACFLLPAIHWQLPHYEEVLWVTYPFAALLTGMAFFVLGSHYWGVCYAFGLAFFGLAVVMPWNLDWASLEFGLLWALALGTIGWHLRRLGSS